MPAMWAIVQKSVLENEPHSVEEEVDERSMFRKATVSDPSPPLSLATGGEAAASLCAVMPSTLPSTLSKPFCRAFLHLHLRSEAFLGYTARKASC